MAGGNCGFDTLFSKNVPHILENIFLALDYESYKACQEVNSTWRELLASESYRTKAKTAFRVDILKDEKKLHIAAESDNTDEARHLLSSGMVDVDVRYKNQTPLHVAASGGMREMAKILLENGANPEVADLSGRTPLHRAAFGVRSEVAQLLIERGVDIDKGPYLNDVRAFFLGFYPPIACMLCCLSAKLDNSLVLNPKLRRHFNTSP